MNRTAAASSITSLFLIALIGAYSFAAHARNLVWADPLTMWQDVSSKSPMKARTHYNYAIMLAGTGDLDGAMKENRRTVCEGLLQHRRHTAYQGARRRGRRDV